MIVTNMLEIQTQWEYKYYKAENRLKKEVFYGTSIRTKTNSIE